MQFSFQPGKRTTVPGGPPVHMGWSKKKLTMADPGWSVPIDSQIPQTGYLYHEVEYRKLDNNNNNANNDNNTKLMIIHVYTQI